MDIHLDSKYKFILLGKSGKKVYILSPFTKLAT